MYDRYAYDVEEDLRWFKIKTQQDIEVLQEVVQDLIKKLEEKNIL